MGFVCVMLYNIWIACTIPWEHSTYDKYHTVKPHQYWLRSVENVILMSMLIQLSILKCNSNITFMFRKIWKKTVIRRRRHTPSLPVEAPTSTWHIKTKCCIAPARSGVYLRTLFSVILALAHLLLSVSSTNSRILLTQNTPNHTWHMYNMYHAICTITSTLCGLWFYYYKCVLFVVRPVICSWYSASHQFIVVFA